MTTKKNDKQSFDTDIIKAPDVGHEMYELEGMVNQSDR